LRYWLTTRTKIRPITLRSYEVHVERHLIPHLGRIRLSELTARHITDMITTIVATTNRYGRTPTKPQRTAPEKSARLADTKPGGAETHRYGPGPAERGARYERHLALERLWRIFREGGQVAARDPLAADG
jgi:hypothetical protein